MNEANRHHFASWLTIALLAAIVGATSPAGAGVAVIVNSENTIASVSQSQLKQLHGVISDVGTSLLTTGTR